MLVMSQQFTLQLGLH